MSDTKAINVEVRTVDPEEHEVAAIDAAKSLMNDLVDEVSKRWGLESTLEYAALIQSYAAIAQAEAAMRQATAVEKRNELLTAYNSVSLEQHTIYRSEVIDFFNTMFGVEKEVTASE